MLVENSTTEFKREYVEKQKAPNILKTDGTTSAAKWCVPIYCNPAFARAHR